MKPYFVGLILLFTWITFDVPTAYACLGEGGVSSNIDILLERDVLVKGVIVENSYGNSIIQVERYLKGSGSEYILLFQQTPSLFQNDRIRGYAYGCYDTHSEVGDVGMDAYFSLNHNLNGTYSINYDGVFSVIPIRNDEHGRYVEYVRFDGENYSNANFDPDKVEFLQVTEAQFEATFAEIYGQVSVLPERETGLANPYPRFRKLIVTTESGQQYTMPIDDTSLIPIDRDEANCSENCPIVSPGGGHIAIPHPIEDDLYVLWYTGRIGGVSLFEDWDVAGRVLTPTQIQAQNILFSPDGEYVLAWYENTLSIYAYNITEFMSINGVLPTASSIWHYQLDANDIMPMNAITGQGTWSADSSAITFWDAEDLKWFNLRRMTEPQTIVERESVFARESKVSGSEFTPVLEISSTGQFIRYGNSNEWVLLDILTGQTYDNAVISPDEANIVKFLPEDLLEDANGVTVDECYAPLLSCFTSLPIPDNHFVKEAHWQTNQFLFVMTCDVELTNNCYTYRSSIEGRYSTYRTDVIGMIPDSEEVPTFVTTDFAYDTIYNEFALAIDEYTLNSIDYSDILDSPIVSLEWGAPLWYLGE